MDLNSFLTGVTANITSKIKPQSISPFVVGSAFSNLATILSGLTSGVSINYQRVQFNTTPQSPQPILNFGNQFNVVNNTGNTSTDISIIALNYNKLVGVPTTLSGLSISSTDTLFDNKYLQITTGYTVSTLPTGMNMGIRTFVRDATSTTFGIIVSGGGNNIMPVFYNGTNWIIA